ncbi:MAG TPA: hypothetical protein VI462_01245 [Acidimicrobiia bacterium]|jgi:hypothetical protein
MDDFELEHVEGDVPEGVGPDVFREHLQRVARHHADDGANITLDDERLYLDDIESVEQEPDRSRSRVRLRSGVIIGGLTGAAIVAALATVRYRRRHRG